MKEKNCCWCNEPIKDEREANFMFGEWSHKKCDEEHLAKQDKNIKYMNKNVV